MPYVERNERRVLGGAVMRIRQAKKVKQDTLAQLAGIHPAYLSNIEHGNKQPSLDVMAKLANGLEVDLSDITYVANVYVVSEDAA